MLKVWKIDWPGILFNIYLIIKGVLFAHLINRDFLRAIIIRVKVNDCEGIFNVGEDIINIKSFRNAMINCGGKSFLFRVKSGAVFILAIIDSIHMIHSFMLYSLNYKTILSYFLIVVNSKKYLWNVKYI